MYGYQDSNEVAPGASGGKFGLNTGVNVTKFEYNPNAGKDGAQQDGIDLTIQIGEREYMKRFFPVSKVFAKGGGEITDTNSPEYKEELEKAVKLLNAELTSIVEAYVSPEEVKAALSAPINSFKDFAQILERLVKSVPNWEKQPVDVFLQYQWQPTGDNDRTYLQLPNNVKQGIYIVKSKGNGYVEDRTDTHLKYYNPENGETHPFKRGKWFVESAFANQTTLNQAPTTAGAMDGGSSASW